MGLLVDGKWQNKGYNTEDSGGKFEREASKLRGWITPDGSAGPGGETGFKAESGRYHLYVSLACPWAHRTLIFRQLKQLEKHIDVSVVSPEMLEQGWRFNTATGSTGDRLHQYDFMHQIYTHSKADYSGRVTVPVLWDTESGCIVNNESSEIIRMMNDISTVCVMPWDPHFHCMNHFDCSALDIGPGFLTGSIIIDYLPNLIRTESDFQNTLNRNLRNHPWVCIQVV